MSKNNYDPFLSLPLGQDSQPDLLPPPLPAIHSELKDINSENKERKASLFQTLLQVPGYKKFENEIELSPMDQEKSSSSKESSNPSKYKKFCESQLHPQPIKTSLPFLLLLRLSWNDLRNVPKSFKIGILTIFMVVGFLTVLAAGNELTPIIFIKLAENQIGDADFIITAQKMNGTKLRLLDSNVVERNCEKVDELFGSSGRWMLYGESYMKERAEVRVKTTVISIDSQKEISIGLGRSLRIHSLKSGECYITKSTSEILKKESKGNIKTINVIVDILGSLSKQESIPDMYKNISMIKNSITSLLPNLGRNEFSDKIVDSLIESLNITTEFRVKEEIEEPKGKFSSVMGNVVMFDMKDLARILLENVAENLNKKQLTFAQEIILKSGLLNRVFEVFWANFTLIPLSMFELVTIRDKLEMYTDEKNVDSKVAKLSNSLMKEFEGENPIELKSSLPEVFKKLVVIEYFLNNIFSSTIFLLCMIGMLLIYSLSMSHVSEKSYEFGMFRALGLQKTHLIILMLAQAFTYSFSGICLAFLFSFILNIFIRNILFDFVSLGGSYLIPTGAVILGLGLGFNMPILANVLPLLKTLSKRLRDSLDLYRRGVDEVVVEIVRLEKMGVGVSSTLNGFLLIFMGILSYYFAPSAFLFRNIKLFLYIMNIILFFLLFGLTALANLLQKPLEKLFIKLWLLLIYKDKPLEKIILKNMSGHSERNSKTALMFSITISFLIFAGTGLKLQSNSINSTLKSQIGADMTIEIPPYTKKPLPESEIRAFLESYNKTFPTHILSYTFLSMPFDQLYKTGTIQISPLTGYPSKKIGLKGLESNYLETVYSEYYIPSEFEANLTYPLLPTGQKDGCYGLFQPDEWRIKTFDKFTLTSSRRKRDIKSDIPAQPMIRVMLQEGARYILNLDTSIPSLIKTRGGLLLSSVSTMTAKLPGFGVRFSSYRTVGLFLQMVCSMPHFKYLMEHAWKGKGGFDELGGPMSLFEMKNGSKLKDYRDSLANFSYGVPKEKLFIKLNGSMERKERIILANGLRNVNEENAVLFDTKLLEEESNGAFFFIDLFFIIVSLIALVLSFFLILVSFEANIQESVQEIGVVRAVGVSRGQVERIFVYEAVTLTFVAGLIGTIVGVSVALILTIQYLGFVELPLQMEFPVVQFLIIFIMGIGAAGVGSWLEIRSLKNLSISTIMKGHLV